MNRHGDDTPHDDGRRFADRDERFADWVDDRMGPRERDRFEAELRVNPQLRRDLDEYERTVGVLRAALRAPSPGTPRAPIADRVLAAIQKEATSPGVRAARPFRWQRLWWTVVSAAALLLVALCLDELVPAPARSEVATLEPANTPPEAGRQADASAAAAGPADPLPASPVAAEKRAEDRTQGNQGVAVPDVASESAERDEAKAKQELAENPEKKALRESLAPGAVASAAPNPVAVAPTPTVAEPSRSADAEAVKSPAPDPRKPAESKPAAPVGAVDSVPSGPATRGLAGAAPGARPEAPGAEPKLAAGGGGAGPGGTTGGAPTADGERAVVAGAPAQDAKPSGGRFGGRGRGGARPTTTTVAMILVEGTLPAQTGEELRKARRAAEPEARTKAKADGAEAKPAVENRVELGADASKSTFVEVLDADTLRARAAAFFALAEDAEAGAAATSFTTKAGRVELQPVLDVTFELDETRVPTGATPVPAAIDRTWLVTGPRADVQVVVASLADWSRQRSLTLRSGETKAAPTLFADTARPGALPAAGTGTVAGDAGAAERMQILLRIRLRARQ